ncbi:hypothetical protein [Nocardioides halotolerans]|uniref:hypothetical protein n=1 Tax=Nocardioides halotolerans TaxID=433660 RepID=UPI0003F79CE0|nr:hypothetical protein [Nocardioides halotolerans]
MKRILHRLSLAHVVAVLAVALVLGSGSAYAAKQITSKNIKNSTIKGVDVKDGALTGADLQDGSIGAAELAPGIFSGGVGDNSVTSAKIVDGTITAADIGTNAVGTDEVAPDSLTDADLASNSVGQAEIQTDGVAATEIADSSIDSGEIVDFGLTNQDIGVLTAQVNADGTLANSSGGVSSISLGTGTYEVDFGLNVSFCTPVVTQGEAGIGGAGGAVTAATDRSGNAEAFFVTTRDFAGALANRAFHLVVVC